MRLLESFLLFLDDNVKEECEKFHIAKIQPQGVAELLLEFWQFHSSVTYKSVAYRKSKYRLELDAVKTKKTGKY